MEKRTNFFLKSPLCPYIECTLTTLIIQNDENQRQKRFGNKQQRKFHQSQRRMTFSWEMKTQMPSPSPPHPHREKSKQTQTLSTATQDRQVGGIWYVASQGVNHDWLTMMVPGSVVGHWLV